MESKIIYQKGKYDVRKAKHGYEVYRAGLTLATRVSQIGYEGEKGIGRAIEEIDRRIKEDEENPKLGQK